MEQSKVEISTVDDYISQFPIKIQEKLQALRGVIREEVPEAKEAIKYQMPAFLYHGNLIYFAAWKSHIALYPTPSGTELPLEELKGYKTGKGTIQFPMDKPLPLELVRKIVRFRVKENLEKAASKT